MPHLEKILGATELPIVTPTLRAMGNIVTKIDEQIQVMIDEEALAILPHTLTNPKTNIQKKLHGQCQMSQLAFRTRYSKVVNHSLILFLVSILRQTLNPKRSCMDCDKSYKW
jgi:importin subunit alpha-2